MEQKQDVRASSPGQIHEGPGDDHDNLTEHCRFVPVISASMTLF